MKRLQRVFCFVSLLFFIANCANGEEFKKLAQTSMKWLSIPVGARPMALGNAYYTAGGNAGDIFWNPAGVAFIESSQLFVSHLPWIVDVQQIAGAFVFPVNGLGVFAVSARAFDFGTLQGTRRSSNEDGFIYSEEFSPSSFKIGLGFMQKLRTRFAYGLNFSYAKEQLGSVYFTPVGGNPENPEKKSTSKGLFNIDFGVLYYTGFYDLRIAMAMKNFSEESGYGNVGNPIPMDWNFGMAMNILPIFLADMNTHSLTFSWNLSHPRDYSERLYFGLEYVFKDFMALRSGYKTNFDEEGISFGAGLMPQFGVGFMKVGVDYAYVPFGIFGSVQCFSLTISF